VNSGADYRRRGAGESFFAQPLAAKVPEITFLFWVVKIMRPCRTTWPWAAR
jgi:hypothetical protein